MFAFLGMIGSFDVSSSEKVYQTGYSYTQIGGKTIPSNSNESRVTYRAPPKPQPWCTNVMENFDISEWFAMDLKQQFGTHISWVVNVSDIIFK